MNINSLIQDIIKKQGDWLKLAFHNTKVICEHRKKLKKDTAAYGFEWAIQTAFSYELIKNKDISNLRIGQMFKCPLDSSEEQKKSKYDLDFEYGNSRIIMELKTIYKRNIAYAKGDITKIYPQNATCYVLVFGYPASSKSLTLNNIDLILKDIGPNQFRYYLYRIKQPNTC